MATTVGTVYVDVKFNVGDVARQLQAQLGAAAGVGGAGAGIGANLERTLSQRMTSIGTSMQSMGRQMSVAMTLPLALIGKAATTSFNEFDKAMTQITALNQVPIAQTEQWRKEVRALGVEYGVAAEEAAQGLYFITSSGVEASDAIQVLDVALKASASGLGETKVIADVLTSAISAYGKANITAAQAGDQLAAAVHYGKGEADELAGALSQVIPLAANAKVSFGEVAGAMAAMTLSGTSADQAATQLRGLFNTLQDMPPISERALTQYTGLTEETLQFRLQTEGLIPTLKGVFDAFGNNKIALAEVFGNIRALTGIMNLFGQNTEHTMEVIKEVTEASGDLNEAWEITARSKSKQMELSMNRLHDSFVGLGETAVPMVTKVTDVLAALASTVDNMPGPVKAATVGLAGIAAVAGPAAIAIGSVVRGFGAITKALNESGRISESTQRSMGSLAGTIGKVTGAVGLAVTAWTLYANAMASAEQAGRDTEEFLKNLSLTGGIATGQKEIEAIDKQIASARKEIEDFKNVSPIDFAKMIVAPWTAAQKAVDFDYIFKGLPEQIAGAERAKAAIEGRIKLANELATATGKDSNAVYMWLASEEKAGRTYGTFAEAQKAWIEGILKGDEAATKLAESNVVVAGSIEDITNKAKAAGDMFFAVRDAEQAVADARTRVAEAGEKVLDAQEAYRQAQERTLEADRKIIEAQRKATEATQATVDARKRLADAQNELNDALAGPSEEERINVESARLSLQEAQKRARGPAADPLDRRRSQLDLRRARLALKEAEGGHDKRIADAREGVADAQKAVNDAVQAELDAQQAVVDARNARAEASRNEARARDDIAKAEQGVRDAQRELFDATSNMVQKQGEFNTALMSGTINANWLLEYLSKLKEMYPNLAGEIEGYMKRVSDAQANAAAHAPTPPPPPAAPPAPVAPPPPPPKVEERGGWTYMPGVRPYQRAAGGPLSAGQLSTVNERNVPELWSAGGKQYLLPVTPGQVIPMRPIDLGEAPKGGDGVTVGDIYVQGASDPVQTAYEVRRQLRVKSRNRART